MHKFVLAAALAALATSPAMACEYMKSVSTPIPVEEEVVMTPAPSAPTATTAASDS